MPRRAARSKRIPKYAALALLPLAAVAAVSAFLPLDRNPADFRIEGSSLIVLSKHGRKLWSFDTKLARIKDESFFRKAFPEKIRHLGEEGHFVTVFPKIFIRDIDQDGKNEVLFNPQTTDELNVGKIFLFDSRGKEKWVFDTRQEIQVGDQKYPRDQFIWYDFDEEMNPSQITVTDRYAEAFNEAVRNGLLAPPLDRPALIKELAAGILYYDGQGRTWVNRRSRADSPADLPNR